MGLPAYIAAGAFVNDATSASVGWPSHSAGDLGLLFVSTANEAVSTPAGWGDVANSPQFTGTPAAAGGVRLHVVLSAGAVRGGEQRRDQRHL